MVFNPNKVKARAMDSSLDRLNKNDEKRPNITGCVKKKSSQVDLHRETPFDPSLESVRTLF